VVDAVTIDGVLVSFTHASNVLTVALGHTYLTGDSVDLVVQYRDRGVPRDEAVAIACPARLRPGPKLPARTHPPARDCGRKLMTPITKSERIYLGAVALLAAWVGAFCYFDTNLADVGIPWRVAPLCAGFLGAMYLSGAVFNGACMLARRWTDVRVVMPMIAMWTGGLLIISLFFLPAFNFARLQVWIWFSAYLIYPLIALSSYGAIARSVASTRPASRLCRVPRALTCWRRARA